MKRLLSLLLAFAVNAYGASSVPNIFATQPSGNVPASYLDTDFALISNYNTFSNYLVDSGAANAYVVTFPAGTTGSLAAGLLVNFKAGADNTGASTLAVNGMTAKSITNYDASALAAGQIKSGAIVSVIYDGTQFKLAGQPGGVTYGTATNFNNGTSSSSGGTVTATTLVGTLSTAAQPNITSLGTIVTLVTSGHTTFEGVTSTGATGTGNLVYSASPSFTGTLGGNTVSMATYQDGGNHLLISSTAPTIAAGFGTSPSIIANNTAAFQVTVGSGGTAFNGTITMPTAPHGWSCSAMDVTTPTTSNVIKQDNNSNATTVGLTNFASTSGSTSAWVAGDKLNVMCMAF